MRVALMFDENDYDIIDLHYACSFAELQEIQTCFYNWLDDKMTDHPFWRMIQGEKAYCEYRADAFIYYLIHCRNIGATLVASFQERPMAEFILAF